MTHPPSGPSTPPPPPGPKLSPPTPSHDGHLIPARSASFRSAAVGDANATRPSGPVSSRLPPIPALPRF